MSPVISLVTFLLLVGVLGGLVYWLARKGFDKSDASAPGDDGRESV